MIRSGSILFAKEITEVEGTEGAAEDTNIRGVDVAVDVVGAPVSPAPLPDFIGQISNPQNVLALQQKESLLRRQSQAAFDPRGDGLHGQVGSR